MFYPINIVYIEYKAEKVWFKSFLLTAPKGECQWGLRVISLHKKCKAESTGPVGSLRLQSYIFF